MGNPFRFSTLQRQVDQAKRFVTSPKRRPVTKSDGHGNEIVVKGVMEPKQRSVRRTGKRAR